MVSQAQKKSNTNDRTRLPAPGVVRFEVTAPEADRDLICALANRLSEKGWEADKTRAAVVQAMSTEPPKPGGILAALRRSPLVGSDIDVARLRVEGRSVDL